MCAVETSLINTVFGKTRQVVSRHPPKITKNMTHNNSRSTRIGGDTNNKGQIRDVRGRKHCDRRRLSAVSSRAEAAKLLTTLPADSQMKSGRRLCTTWHGVTTAVAERNGETLPATRREPQNLPSRQEEVSTSERHQNQGTTPYNHNQSHSPTRGGLTAEFPRSEHTHTQKPKTCRHEKRAVR